MTEIVLHRLAAIPQPVTLTWPWVWWEARIYPDEHGNLMYQHYRPAGETFDQCSVTFGASGSDIVVTDPPALNIVSVQDDYSPYYSGHDSHLFRTHVGPRYMIVRVVWHEPPGEMQNVHGAVMVQGAWHPLAVHTCMAGQYEFETLGSRDAGPLKECDGAGPFRRRVYDLPPLQWPQTPTIRNGIPSRPQPVDYQRAVTMLSQFDPRYHPVQPMLPQLPAPQPTVTARHRKQPKKVDPIPTAGTRNIDGINDDGIIARIDALIDDELAGGEYERGRQRGGADWNPL